jgi:hypothetical protein
MIYEQYEYAIDVAASKPVPQDFTAQNLEDLHSMRLQAA